MTLISSTASLTVCGAALTLSCATRERPDPPSIDGDDPVYRDCVLLPAPGTVRPGLLWRHRGPRASVLREGRFMVGRLPPELRIAFKKDRMGGSTTIRKGDFVQDNQHAQFCWEQAQCRVNSWVRDGTAVTQSMIEDLNSALRGQDPARAREMWTLESEIIAESEMCLASENEAGLQALRKRLQEIHEQFTGVEPLYYSKGCMMLSLRPPYTFLMGETMRLAESDIKSFWDRCLALVGDQSLPPIVKAAKVYQDISTIHRFHNGNGRTARLFMDYVLMMHGYPPALFGDQKVHVANFARVARALAILFGEDQTMPAENYFVPLSDVVDIVSDGVLRAKELICSETDRYEMPPIELMDRDAIDALTLKPWELKRKAANVA